jgi:hypothetical protein
MKSNAAVGDKARSDREYEAAVLREFDSRVRHCARRFPPQYHGDLVQIGRMALLCAARTYNARDGHTAQVWTYARSFVIYDMMHFVTREVGRTALELEAHEQGESLAPQPFVSQDTLVEARELAALVKSERDAQVLAAHLAGDDIRTIAEEVHVGKSTAHDILKGTLENLRDLA